MKYYQCKNQRKAIYPIFCFYIITTGFVSVIALSGILGEKSILGGLCFTLCALLGIIIFFRSTKNIFGYFKSTIELTENGILYSGAKKEVEINWKDITMIYMWPNDFQISLKRVIYFMTVGTSQYRLNSKVSEKMIWSEYNDEMLEEIKKYWHGIIVNEDKYLKWKSKKNRN